MSKYDSITIKDAMNNIATNTYLLPSIQRNFVWSMEQIETLFDSLLRNYPINSFMLWKITDKSVKKNYKFYQFLREFVQKFGETNTECPTKLLTNDFYAVIDGQQRLTSLYIALVGSYTVKKPNKRWKADRHQTEMIEKKLYLELSKELQPTIDNQKTYNFKFLSSDDIQNDKSANPSHIWFPVSEILKFGSLPDVNAYIISNNLVNQSFAVNALTQLFSKVNQEEVINYYVVDSQDQDKVLEVFIRTNSGGTPLSFSDLLMSIAAANWSKFDAKEEIRETIDSIYSYGNPNFCVSQDFVLKSLLVLSDGDVRFKISNFGKRNIESFELKWPEIKKSIIAAFHLLSDLNFNEILLRSKNAVIPIAYYIYKNRLFDTITKSTYDSDDKLNISKWLSMSLLNGIFGGTSDSVLKTMRDVIAAHIGEKFPISAIIDAYRLNLDTNYNFTDEMIESLLYEQYGSPSCGIILNLLYPTVVMRNGNSVAEDHMHPRTVFESDDKLITLGLSDDQLDFFKNKQNYNSCLNLQLLEALENNSKLDTPLKDWVERKGLKNDDLLIEKGVSLELKDFTSFIESRRKILLEKLKSILN